MMNISFLSSEVQDCIKACWECRTHCQKTLYHHCLEKGGKHAEAAHVKIMTDCMEMCQTAADFMVRGSSQTGAACTACADVCHACAESCAAIDDKHMQECADMCRACAEKCDDLSLSHFADGNDKSIENAVTLV